MQINTSHLGSFLPPQGQRLNNIVQKGQGIFQSVVNIAREPSKDAGLITAGIVKTLFAAAGAIGGAAITTFIKDNTAFDLLGKALMFIATPLMGIWAVRDFLKLKSSREIPPSTPGSVFDINNGTKGNDISSRLVETAAQLNILKPIKLDISSNEKILIKQIENYDALFKQPEFSGTVTLKAKDSPDLIFSGVEGDLGSLRRIRENYSLLLSEAQLRESEVPTLTSTAKISDIYLPNDLEALRFTTQFRILHKAAREFGSDGKSLPQLVYPLVDEFKIDIAGYRSLGDAAKKTAVNDFVDNYTKTSNVLNILNGAISKVLEVKPNNEDEERDIALIRAALITGFKITKSGPDNNQMPYVNSVLAQRRDAIINRLQTLTEWDKQHGVRAAFDKSESFDVQNIVLDGITNDIISIESKFRTTNP